MTTALEYRVSGAGIMSYKPRGIVDFYYEAKRKVVRYSSHAAATMKDILTKYKSDNDPWYVAMQNLYKKSDYKKEKKEH